MLKQYVLKYRTPEDLEELKEIQAKRAEAFKRQAAAKRNLQKAVTDNKAKQGADIQTYTTIIPAEVQSEYDKATLEYIRLNQEEESVFSRAEERYIAHFKADNEDKPEEEQLEAIKAAILEDIREKISALDETEKGFCIAKIDSVNAYKKAERLQYESELEKARSENNEEKAAKCAAEIKRIKAAKYPRYWYFAQFIDNEIIYFQRRALAFYKILDEVNGIEDQAAAAFIAECIADKAREWGETIEKPLPVFEIQRRIKYNLPLAILPAQMKQESAERVLIPVLLDRGAASVEWEDQGQGGLFPRVKGAEVNFLEYPLDKIDRGLWRLSEEDLGGQLRFALEKHGSKREISALVSINFDALDAAGIKFTRQLTQFDKRVYIAAGALFNTSPASGTATARQIYYAMGNYKKSPDGKEKNPSAADIEKIDASLTKLSGTKLVLDNSEEVRAGYNYDLFSYDGALLPMERVTQRNVNGKIIDSAIHMFREPPLLSFAKGRGQVTTIPRGLLEVALNNTEAKLAIEDYLIERIAHATRDKKASVSILLDTLYREAKLDEKKKRQRAAEKIRTLLDHYKAQAYIKSYRILKDKIEITLTEN